jgi:hypothetical protein
LDNKFSIFGTARGSIYATQGSHTVFKSSSYAPLDLSSGDFNDYYQSQGWFAPKVAVWGRVNEGYFEGIPYFQGNFPPFEEASQVYSATAVNASTQQLAYLSTGFVLNNGSSCKFFVANRNPKVRNNIPYAQFDSGFLPPVSFRSQVSPPMTDSADNVYFGDVSGNLISTKAPTVNTIIKMQFRGTYLDQLQNFIGCDGQTIAIKFSDQNIQNPPAARARLPG